MISPKLPVVVLSFGLFAGCFGVECNAQVLHYHFYSGPVPLRHNFVVTEPSRMVTYTWSARPTVHNVSQDMMGTRSTARPEIYETQGEANRGWCLEMRHRQFAQPSPMSLDTARSLAQVPPARDIRHRSSPPAEQLVRWPTVLQSATYATQRNSVETPFRRWLGGGRQPSPAEYRAMAETSHQLKAMLREAAVANGVTVRDYLESAEFLDRLGVEAQDRAVRCELASNEK
jgi:hypothetical protein